MKSDRTPTHTAPYYGGERFARTLEEAFGPGAELEKEDDPPVDSALPWVMIALALIAAAASFIDWFGEYAR